jgi:hypothetical protein
MVQFWRRFAAYPSPRARIALACSPLKALESFQKSLAIAEGLANADPSNAGRHRALAIIRGHLAMALAKQDNGRALDELRKGRSILARLKERSPDDATLANDLAWFDAEIAKLEQRKVPETGSVQSEQPGP